MDHAERTRLESRMTELVHLDEAGKLTDGKREELHSIMTRLSIDEHRSRSNGAWESRTGVQFNDRDTDYDNPKLILRGKDSYQKWLMAQEPAKYGRDGFDIPAFWTAMAKGDKSAPEFRASMQEGVSADGGYLVPSPVAGEFIDMLRARVVFMAGEGNVVPWNTGSTLAVPIWTSDPLVQNLGETVDMFPPASDATVNRVVLTARPYMSVETFTWELLQDSALDVADVAQKALAKRLAVNIQSDFIYNSAANKVQGFTQAAGLLTGVQGGGANGVAPTNWDYVDLAVQAVRNANVEPDLIATTPQAYGKLGRLKDTQNNSLRPSRTIQDFLDGANGKTLATTTAISDAVTVGTTANCSDLFVMDTSRIYWGIRRDFSVLPLKERFSTQRMGGLVAFLRIDGFLSHPEGAYWLKGALTTGT